MRYVVYGAGGIGSAIGFWLQRTGCDVVLIARGAHREAVARDGLTLVTPDGTFHERLVVVEHPSQVELTTEDVVILAMKTQDTHAALMELRGIAPKGVPIACAQNGVENERAVLRHVGRVLPVLVRMPTTFVEPGRVSLNRSPVWGVLDVGVLPHREAPVLNPVAVRFSSDLNQAGFDSRVAPDMMAWKHAKLIANLPNAAYLACGKGADLGDLIDAAVAEAEACFQAAGIAWVDLESFADRVAHLPKARPIEGDGRIGSSTVQSVLRGRGRVETDYLNGEVALLGRLHGVPTPVNDVLCRAANTLAVRGEQPGSVDPASLHADVAALRRRVG